MTGYFSAGPRALVPGDAEPVRALVWGALGVTPYVDRVMELLASAERGDTDRQALITERDGTVAALSIFGPVSAALDVWNLNVVLVAPGVDLREVGRAMVEAAVDVARQSHGRLVVAELPADAALGRSLGLLRASGFRQEGRIVDFFRAGVALLFLRRDL